MPNYQDSKIYKLESAGGLYIGSTTYNLSHRLSVHKAIYKRYMSGAVNSCPSSKIILEHPDYKISLIELFPCSTKQELRDRECFHIMTFPECVNIQMRQTKDEIYTRHNRERREKYHQARETTREQREAVKVAKKEATKKKQQLKSKELYERNREAFIEKSKTHYEANKEHFKEYYQQNRAKHIEYTKAYYERNKEILNARINCPICNKSMVKNSLRNHMPRFHPVPSDVAVE